ncbi:hypothetical protein AtubIFM56815_001563 [Aspergillus tubingensis]|nr:hypothetical protein AtubIFM56815_001563 [Aspergillus tubingensis]
MSGKLKGAAEQPWSKIASYTMFHAPFLSPQSFNTALPKDNCVLCFELFCLFIKLIHFHWAAKVQDLQFNMIVTRGISLTNFVVASSALAFQVFVLYPWHKQLDDGFEALKKEHLRVLKSLEQLQHDSRKQLDERLA